MSLTTEQYAKIIHFLDAEMDIAEMESFEKELYANPEMRQQLDFEQSVRDNLGFINKAALSPIFSESLHVQPSIEPIRKKSGIKRWLSVAAAAAILLMLSLLFKPKVDNTTFATTPHNKDSAPNSKNSIVKLAIEPVKDSTKNAKLALLYSQFYKKDKLPDVYPLFLADALTKYEMGDYGTLQQLNLSELPETRGIDDSINSKENILLLANYYKGISFLETNNTSKAIAHFNWILKKKPNKDLSVKTEWYLALGYLKGNELEKAENLLVKIDSSLIEHELKNNAKSLLKKLANK